MIQEAQKAAKFYLLIYLLHAFVGHRTVSPLLGTG